MHTQTELQNQAIITAGINCMAVTEEQNITSERITIESRFGPVTVNLANAILFPQGLLGLPDNLYFCLTDIPGEGDLQQFKLLQCLNDHSLSFVVLPLDIENSLIEKNDILDCCKQCNIPEENLATLLIVSIQRSPEGAKVTANVRAPIMIDAQDRAAIQFVFPNSKYNICHPL